MPAPLPPLPAPESSVMIPYRAKSAATNAMMIDRIPTIHSKAKVCCAANSQAA